MEANDRKRFTELIVLLLEGFGKEASPATFEAYWMGLEDVPLELVEQGVRNTLQTAKFMPSPAELAGRVSLRRPGLFKCGGCGVDFSFPESSRRGYCGPCWKSIGGEEEDARLLALEEGDSPKEITG